uniref:Ubiquitin domain containing 1 n=1 Tax=Gallus gallus TaxID=9031 RepID=A0A8V0ZLJ3_CHICK
MGGCVGRQRRERPSAGSPPQESSPSCPRSVPMVSLMRPHHRTLGPVRWGQRSRCRNSPRCAPAFPSGPRQAPGGRHGRNEPLKKERPKWKSDYPMTDGQLRSKRDEFWDTAPAFEGRKEIWDALKAAAYAVEANDHSLAQAILDGASITLPHGSLTECYDELGNRYQLPVYCLAPPVNLILERGEEEAAEPAEPPPNARREFALKVRLSTGKDLRLSASMADTIGQLKKQLQAQEGIDLAWQRWFFSGKLLTDRTRLQETKIQKDFVVQVIVNQPLPPRN